MKIALITGASSGIGASITKMLLNQNEWQVIGISSRKRTDEQITWLHYDFNFPDTLENIPAELRSKNIHRIDLLIHCGAQFKSQNDLSYNECESLTKINLIAPYVLTEKVSPLLCEKSKIIFFSSASSRITRPGAEMYGATKAGIESLTKGFAYRLGTKGTVVIGLAPSVVLSPMLELDDIDKYRIARQTPQNFLPKADDIATLVKDLIKLDSPLINGAVIDISGGMHLSYGQEIWTEDGKTKEGFAKIDNGTTL